MAETPSTPRYLRPFVVDEAVREPTADDGADLYLPDESRRRPAIVFLHGGPVRPEATPKEWPVYRGYGSLAARLGLVAAAFNHPFHDIEHLHDAAAEVERVLGLVRRSERVDPDRVGIWAFSGAGLFAGRFIGHPPEWLRAVALTYPDCRRDDDPDWPTTLADAVEHSADLPILLTRVGREQPDLAAAVEEFVKAARGAAADLTVLDVPDGEHGFDHSEPTSAARTAVLEAMAWMVDRLTR
jgi:dienelactone hydrolase